eukprot:g27112.t1
MLCCLLSARVKDVSEDAQDILKGDGEQPGAVIHIGANNTSRKCDEFLQKGVLGVGTVKKAFSTLAFIAQTFGYRSWEVMLRLYRTLEDIIKLERVQKRFTNMLPGGNADSDEEIQSLQTYADRLGEQDRICPMEFNA